MHIVQKKLKINCTANFCKPWGSSILYEKLKYIYFLEERLLHKNFCIPHCKPATQVQHFIVVITGTHLPNKRHEKVVNIFSDSVERLLEVYLRLLTSCCSAVVAATEIIYCT
jgi:hypothetical protein